MSATTSRDGVRIAYETTGDGPLGVVFVHGWSSSKSFWDPVIAELPLQGRQFVQLDLRGHGNSTVEGCDHSVVTYTEDILAAAAAASVERFVTVGHSMGAKYAQYLRVLAPERLIGQVAIAPTPSTTVDEESSEETIALMSSWSGDIEAMRSMFTHITKRPLPNEVVALLAAQAASVPAEVLASSIRAFSQTDVSGEIAEAPPAPPTLYISGTDDPFYSQQLHESRIREETPHASLMLLDCGHDPIHEKPHEVGLLVSGFLAALQR